MTICYDDGDDVVKVLATLNSRWPPLHPWDGTGGPNCWPLASDNAPCGTNSPGHGTIYGPDLTLNDQLRRKNTLFLTPNAVVLQKIADLIRIILGSL